MTDPSASAGWLQGRKVCLAGHFVAMSQAELAQLIFSLGGTYLRNPRRTGFLLVVGDNGWPAQADGAISRTVRYARRIEALGYPVEQLSETEFFERFGLIDADGPRRYTIADLSKILSVSAVRLRRWVQIGLIAPVVSRHRLAYFDFDQVAGARRLCDLLASGATPVAVRAGLEQLRHWLPPEKLPLELLSRFEHDGRLLLRLEGRLLEPRGQRLFEFDRQVADENEAVVCLAAPIAEHDSAVAAELFERALALEDDQRWAEAAACYADAIRAQPEDPALHFNLGNVLYRLARYTSARDSFETALRQDAAYAEAWNNLGSTLVQLALSDAAETAFRRALALVPDFDAAQANLADLLSRAGRAAEAAQHRPRRGALRKLSPNLIRHQLRVMTDDSDVDDDS